MPMWARGSTIACALLLAACSGNDGPSCSGAEGCACYANGTCDGTLTCASSLCVHTSMAVVPPGAAGSLASAGSGSAAGPAGRDGGGAGSALSGAGQSGGAGSGPGGAGQNGGTAGSSGGAGAPSNAAPTFLSFGTNVTALHPQGTVIFSAILTDPDGIDDLIGGSLVDPVSSATYGTFATEASEGAYSLTLTWDAVQAVRPIQTELGDGPRPFRAEFFDQAGHKVSDDASVMLDCDGDGGVICELLKGMGMACEPIVCNGYCTDTRDSTNCGTCGNKCSMTEYCSVDAVCSPQ